MGHDVSRPYMNIHPLAFVTMTTEKQLYTILDKIEAQSDLKQSISAVDYEDEVGEQNSRPFSSSEISFGFERSTSTKSPSKSLRLVASQEDKDKIFTMTQEEFSEIIRDENIGLNSTDIELFLNIFQLIDLAGVGKINVQKVCVIISMLVTNDIEHCLECSLACIDRPYPSDVIEKKELLGMFTVMNDGLYYFGDKFHLAEHIENLVNSTYTTAGLLDGPIGYKQYISYMAAHPIVELLVSIQFQGNVRSKILSKEEIEKHVYLERIKNT